MKSCSAFLHTFGQARRDVYHTMRFSEEEQDKVGKLFIKFKTYCRPKQNVTIGRYCFNTCIQGKQETIDQIHD